MLALRRATLADAPLLAAWDKEPHVIAATTDDNDAKTAHGDMSWEEELAAQSAVSYHVIAELDGRPIGAMQIIDPALEPTHYWGDMPPNLRALDIWIGPADALGKGYGEEMMLQAFALCFADPKVTAIVIDPLASNTRAHKFYQRLGFVPVGRRLFHGEDDCLVHELTRESWEQKEGSG